MAPSTDDHVRQLTRKLYWAISSTFPHLKREDKAKTFRWAADMAERIISRVVSSLPPSVDTDSSNGYHGQAEGRGGGRYDPSIRRGAQSPPPADMEAWERQQAGMRVRAWAYVLKGRENGRSKSGRGNSTS